MATTYGLLEAVSSMTEPLMMLWRQPFNRRSGKCSFLHLYLAGLSDIHTSLIKQEWDPFTPRANFAVMTYRPNYFLVYWNVISALQFTRSPMWKVAVAESWMAPCYYQGSLINFFSFELDFPYENLFNFHNQGTFRQETGKFSSKMSSKQFLIRPSHPNKLVMSAAAHTLQIFLQI